MAMSPARTAVPARTLAPLAALAAIYAASLAILHSVAFARAPHVLSAAVAFDLTVTAAAAVWWLGVRRAGWPRWTLGATVAAGLGVGRMTLPGGGVATLLIGLWAAGELALAVIAIARLRTVVRVARADRGPGPVAAVEAGLRAAAIPPRLAAILATDAVAFGLGLGGWFRRAPADGFAMHRRKSWPAIAALLIALISIETVAVHLLLATWSGLAAWIATAMSIYAVVWLAADLHALRLYPLRVTADAVVVSVGLRWRIAIPRDAIASVALGETAPDGALDASVLEPTVVLTLTRPIEARGPFGLRRAPSAIALTVDDPDRLIAALAPGAEPSVAAPPAG